MSEREERRIRMVLIEIADLVDDANIYHLWVLPEGFELPFGLTHSIR